MRSDLHNNIQIVGDKVPETNPRPNSAKTEIDSSRSDMKDNILSTIFKERKFKFVQTAFSAVDINIDENKSLGEPLRKTKSQDEFGMKYHYSEIEEEIFEWLKEVFSIQKTRTWSARLQKIAEKLNMPGGEEKLRKKIAKYLTKVPSQFSDCDENGREFREQLPENIIRNLKKMYCKTVKLGSPTSFRYYADDLRFNKYLKKRNRFKREETHLKTVIRNWLKKVPLKKKDFWGRSIKKGDILNSMLEKIALFTSHILDSDRDYKSMLISYINEIVPEIPIETDNNYKEHYIERITENLTAKILNTDQCDEFKRQASSPDSDFTEPLAHSENSVDFKYDSLRRYTQPTIQELKHFVKDEIKRFLLKSDLDIGRKRMAYVNKKLTETLMLAIESTEISEYYLKKNIFRVLMDIGKLTEYQTKHLFNILFGKFKNEYLVRRRKTCENRLKHRSKTLRNAVSETYLLYCSTSHHQTDCSKKYPDFSMQGIPEKDIDTNVKKYTEKLANEIDQWLESLPRQVPLAHQQDFREMAVNDLVEGIVGKHKHSEHNKTSHHSESRNLKYQIYEWIQKLVGKHNKETVRYAPELIRKIRNIPQVYRVEETSDEENDSYVLHKRSCCRHKTGNNGQDQKDSEESDTDKLYNVIFDWLRNLPNDFNCSEDETSIKLYIRNLAESIEKGIRKGKKVPSEIIDREVNSWTKTILNGRQIPSNLENLKARIKYTLFGEGQPDNNQGSLKYNTGIGTVDDLKKYTRNLEKQITKVIDEWLINLLSDEDYDKAFKDIVVNDLAVDIVERYKYIERIPSSRRSGQDELEHLKFQIFKYINKLVGEENLYTIVQAPELMKRIKTILDPISTRHQKYSVTAGPSKTKCCQTENFSDYRNISSDSQSPYDEGRGESQMPLFNTVVHDDEVAYPPGQTNRPDYVTAGGTNGVESLMTYTSAGHLPVFGPGYPGYAVEPQYMGSYKTGQHSCCSRSPAFGPARAAFIPGHNYSNYLNEQMLQGTGGRHSNRVSMVDPRQLSGGVVNQELEPHTPSYVHNPIVNETASEIDAGEIPTYSDRGTINQMPIYGLATVPALRQNSPISFPEGPVMRSGMNSNQAPMLGQSDFRGQVIDDHNNIIQPQNEQDGKSIFFRKDLYLQTLPDFGPVGPGGSMREPPSRKIPEDRNLSGPAMLGNTPRRKPRLLLDDNIADLKGMTLEQTYKFFDNIFQERCKQLPIDLSTPEQQAIGQAAHQAIRNAIWMTYFRLKSNPKIENDYVLFEEQFEERIDLVLDVLEQTPEVTKMRLAWKAKVVFDVVRMLQYIHSLSDTPSFRNKLAIELDRRVVQTHLKSVSDYHQHNFVVDTADAYILYTKYKNEDSVKANIYRQRLMTKIDELAENIQIQTNLLFPKINETRLKQDAFKILGSVPLPNDETLKDEANEILIGEEIEQWYTGLPVRPIESQDDANFRNRKKILMAKRINEIEKQVDTDDPSVERELKHEVSKFFEVAGGGNLQTDQDLNINFMVDELVNRLKRRRQHDGIGYNTFEKGKPACSSLIRSDSVEVMAPLVGVTGRTAQSLQSTARGNLQLRIPVLDFGPGISTSQGQSLVTNPRIGVNTEVPVQYDAGVAAGEELLTPPGQSLQYTARENLRLHVPVLVVRPGINTSQGQSFGISPEIVADPEVLVQYDAKVAAVEEQQRTPELVLNEVSIQTTGEQRLTGTGNDDLEEDLNEIRVHCRCTERIYKCKRKRYLCHNNDAYNCIRSMRPPCAYLY